MASPRSIRLEAYTEGKDSSFCRLMPQGTMAF
jgi:hypothetical protein